MQYEGRPSTAFQVRGASRGQGRTQGDQGTWWRGLRIADRRTISTLRLLVQVTGFARLILHNQRVLLEELRVIHQIAREIFSHVLRGGIAAAPFGVLDGGLPTSPTQ